jgi:hypothetical protein
MAVFGIAVVYRVGMENFKWQGRNNYEIRNAVSSKNYIKETHWPRICSNSRLNLDDQVLNYKYNNIFILLYLVSLQNLIFSCSRA